jgi:transcriptional antiterminator NusG
MGMETDVKKSEGEAMSLFGMQTHSLEKSYGCAFCATGKEEAVARSIEKTSFGVRAMTVRQIKRKSLGGRTSLIDQVAFPGYVFIEVEPVETSILHLPRENVKALLTTPNSGWKLSGSDERFAKWVFSIGGLITLSDAHMEGDRVRIINGPLKDLEGYIRKIDKRNRNGQIALMFNNRTVTAWLGYEMVETSAELK